MALLQPLVIPVPRSRFRHWPHLLEANGRRHLSLPLLVLVVFVSTTKRVVIYLRVHRILTFMIRTHIGVGRVLD